jgi:hypothetical protein
MGPTFDAWENCRKIANWMSNNSNYKPTNHKNSPLVPTEFDFLCPFLSFQTRMTLIHEKNDRAFQNEPLRAKVALRPHVGVRGARDDCSQTIQQMAVKVQFSSQKVASSLNVVFCICFDYPSISHEWHR